MPHKRTITIPWEGGTLALPDAVADALPAREGMPLTIGRSGASVLLFGDALLKAERANPLSRNEHAALRKLRGAAFVPEIRLSHEENSVLFLLSRRLPGRMACAPEHLQNPRATIRLLAKGLQALWDAGVPAPRGGFSLQDKLDLTRGRVERGEVDWATLPEDIQATLPGGGAGRGFPSAEALWRELDENRPDETPTLSHGDYCLPNVFIADGQVTGFCDWGCWGVADPWQDIALCARSCGFNFGMPGGDCRDALLSELGVPRDDEKERYYLLLDALF